MEEKSDAGLVELSRRGDKAAFGELVRRYEKLAGSIARKLVSQDACAQELVQDSMLQAYLSLDRLRDTACFKGWLCGIVLNVCRSYLRDQKTAFFSLESLAGGMQLDASAFAETDVSPERMAEEQELHQIVLEAVNALSTRDREVTLSFYYDQLNAQEIAGLLNISVGAVKVRLHRARQHLKERLLARYPEFVRSKSRSDKMTKVKIMDVLKREQKNAQGQTLDLYVIILVDEAGGRAMPIWVGAAEGQGIAMQLGGMATPRPMTYNFFAGLLKAIDAKLEEVRIVTLKQDTFYATVKIKCGSMVREVDARPSDAMNLALLCDCPIQVDEEVMAKASVKLPEKAIPAAAHSGIDKILEEIKKQHSGSKPSLPLSKEEQMKSTQEFVTGLFVQK